MTIPFDEIEAIFFDLDGTLIDTDDEAVLRLTRRLRPFLGDARGQRWARWLLMKAETPGNSFITLLDMLGIELALMGFADKLRRRRGLHDAPNFTLIAGVEEMILSLNGRYQLGIVTTRTRYHIDHLLQQFPAMGAAFAVTVGAQDTRRLKPHPAPVLRAAEQLGIPVERCLMVGDTTVDVLSAKRAGAWHTAVLCGFGERGELERVGAHLILPTTADLLAYL